MRPFAACLAQISTLSSIDAGCVPLKTESNDWGVSACSAYILRPARELTWINQKRASLQLAGCNCGPFFAFATMGEDTDLKSETLARALAVRNR